MVQQINIWFIPRSRSTALMKCLSQIPESKTFFEAFLWAFYLGDEDSIVTDYPHLVPEKAKEHIVPGFNYKSVLKQFKECDAKVTVMKDFIFALKGRFADVIDKDSVNIFLCRDPKYVFSSFLSASQKYFYEVTKQNHPDVTIHYQAMLQGIDYVTKNCSKHPIIIDGTTLSSKEGSVKAIQAICQAAGVEFSESLLTWPATEGTFSEDWVVPKPTVTVNSVLGFFSKAHSSTGFEDAKEREVDLEELAKTQPQMVEDIKLCQPFYNQIVSLPFKI